MIGSCGGLFVIHIVWYPFKKLGISSVLQAIQIYRSKCFVAYDNHIAKWAFSGTDDFLVGRGDY